LHFLTVNLESKETHPKSICCFNENVLNGHHQRSNVETTNVVNGWGQPLLVGQEEARHVGQRHRREN